VTVAAPLPPSLNEPPKARRSHPVRRRITLVIVSVVAGALLVTGFGTLLLLQAQARQDTRRDLIQLGENVRNTAQLIVRPLPLQNLRTALRTTQDIAIIAVPPGALDRLPRGIDANDLQLGQLRAGQTVSGFQGRTAYAVVPFTAAGRSLAVAVTQPVSRAGAAGFYLLVTGALALLVAAGAAEALSRRITRPLIGAEDATRRIAEGDLSVRVPISARESDELLSLSESINAMATNLERLRGSERQFLMSVSHDLRTPLTSIRGFAEALTDGTTTDVGRAADVIAAEARRLERLVRDLLDLAKLDANRFSLDLRPVDVMEVLSDTVDGFVPAAGDAGLELVLHDPGVLDAAGRPVAWNGPLPPVSADPDRLAQAVANLIENAMKFANRSVEVTAWYRSGLAQITVDDDGPGIAPGDLPHVFERLWTGAAGTPKRQIGSGLGLAIVNDLIGAMGGAVRAESPVPRATSATAGTRMTVTLRLWATASSSSPAASV
jgi:signal transduction histidine kinase